MVSESLDYSYRSIIGIALGGYSRSHGGGPSLRIAFPVNDEILETRIVFPTASAGYIRKIRQDGLPGNSIKAIGKFFVGSTGEIFFELVAYATITSGLQVPKKSSLRPAGTSDVEAFAKAA